MTIDIEALTTRCRTTDHMALAHAGVA